MTPVVRVVYPLIDSKTKQKSQYYTMTNYDKYKHGRHVYYRGEPMFFAEDLKGRSRNYQLLEFKPLTIEEMDGFNKWLCTYDTKRKSQNSSDYIAAYASYKMITGK